MVRQVRMALHLLQSEPEDKTRMAHLFLHGRQKPEDPQIEPHAAGDAITRSCI